MNGQMGGWVDIQTGRQTGGQTDDGEADDTDRCVEDRPKIRMEYCRRTDDRDRDREEVVGKQTYQHLRVRTYTHVNGHTCI